jgi:dihydroorotate dehydrogenase electron transfer subunit
MRLDSLGETQAWIDCPSGLVPEAGQFVLAHSPEDKSAPLAACLFPSELPDTGFWAAAPVPQSWLPGTELEIHGVCGHGFSKQSGARRIALASLSNNPARVLPLVEEASLQGAAVTLFSNPPLPSLPSWLEIYPLASLPELLHWPDFLAIDLPLDSLPALRRILGLQPDQRLPYPAQALIYTPMPCGGLAECGACAIPSHRGWKMACSDGPVFDLNNIEW